MRGKGKLELVSRAKINLTLEVLSRRPDGYHELRSVMQELALSDSITLQENSRSSTIELACEHPDLPRDHTNLAVQAAALLQRTYAPGKGVHIRLAKRIPIAAGLGGGSSNAAAVLQGLNLLWGLHLEQPVLQALAARLGSDVPFFLAGGTALAEGRGEKIFPLPPFPSSAVLLAAPAGAVLSAGDVYRNLHLAEMRQPASTEKFLKMLKDPSLGNRERLSELQKLFTNNLEEAVFSLNPGVRLLKKELCSAGLTALVSGSGPTVFAVAGGEHLLLHLAESLRGRGYRVIITGIHPGREPEKSGDTR